MGLGSGAAAVASCAASCAATGSPVPPCRPASASGAPLPHGAAAAPGTSLGGGQALVGGLLVLSPVSGELDAGLLSLSADLAHALGGALHLRHVLAEYRAGEEILYVGAAGRERRKGKGGGGYREREGRMGGE